MDQLTFSLEEPPASHSVARVCAKDWQTLVATWPLNIFALLTEHSRAGSSGKTFPAYCRRTKDGTLAPSSGRWLNSGMGMHGGCWMLNTSEWPSTAVVCSLSDILKTGDLPQRFFLSAKACAGILRRAETRRLRLPHALEHALIAAIGRTPKRSCR